MKMNTNHRTGGRWKQLALTLAAGTALLTSTASAGTWGHSAWTGDADSGIGSAASPPAVQSDYTVAVNTSTADSAVGGYTVNGINFQAHTMTPANAVISGLSNNAGRAAGTVLVSGASSGLVVRHASNVGSGKFLTFPVVRGNYSA